MSDLSTSCIIWNQDQEIIFDEVLPSKTVALAGQGSADYTIGQLGDAAFFISPVKSNKANVTLPRRGNETVQVELGKPETIDTFTLLLCRSSVNGRATSTGRQVSAVLNGEAILDDLIEWSKAPLDESVGFEKRAQGFLDGILEKTKASNAMIVHCSNPSEMSLSAYAGLSLNDAQTLWEKMPPLLIDQIMQKESKMILPAGLEGSSGDKTTVFISGIRSVVGFPVISGGRVFAILYIGFKNLLRDLNQDLQKNLERAADLIGLILQSALVREELNSVRLKTKEKSESDKMMIGNSKALDNVYSQINKLAAIDIPLLITGETGTGKELTAKEIHRYSNRKDGSFVAVNCSSIPEDLLESHLFGYKKGAFTGALSDHEGLVAKANGGTLFLDEIGEIPLNIQVKLLRVLQEKIYMRVGDNKEETADFRLVSATHQDLDAMIKDGKFRQDLFYRIAGANVHLPPLRERVVDILPLANFFKEKFSQSNGLSKKAWSSAAIKALEDYEWPGNIRQLEHLVCRASVMAESEVIKASDLGIDGVDEAFDEKFDEAPKIELGVTTLEPLATAKDRWLRNYIHFALSQNKGSRSETAKKLEIGQRTLFRYIEQLDIKDT